jgi:hypothetical protein
MFEQALVTRYAKLHALSNMIEAWLKEKRQELLEAFDAKLNPETKKWEASNKCPDRGPFVIVLGDAEAKPNWKEEFRSYLIGTLDRTPEEAEATLKTIGDRERPRDPRLYCRANPNYRREFKIRLPR